MIGLSKAIALNFSIRKLFGLITIDKSSGEVTMEFKLPGF